MFSLISKITRRLTRFPVAVLLFGTIFAILSAFPIMNLRWDLQLQDTLSFSDESNNDYKRIESDFGGLGHLHCGTTCHAHRISQTRRHLFRGCTTGTPPP